jgi:hypothetical protein
MVEPSPQTKLERALRQAWLRYVAGLRERIKKEMRDNGN